MKTISKCLGLSLMALTHLSLFNLPSASAASSAEYEALVRQSDHRKRQESRVLEESQHWSKSSRPPEARLLDEVRMQVNLSPRHRVLRPMLQRMLAASQPSPSNPQWQELYYYRLLNLDPQNKDYQSKLANLLKAKHGGASAAQVSQAYRWLNDGFNHWDEGKTESALALFKQAALPKSPELNAIYAYHLRDSGRLAEAKAVLQKFSGQRDYLKWIDQTLAEIKSAETIVNARFPEADKLAARIKLGELERADQAITALPESHLKHWHRAKWYEKQGQYHPAAKEYQLYYQGRWSKELSGFVPVVYKAQLEDINSLDLIALKFRTSPELIRKVNQEYPYDWVETYRMLVVPVIRHDLSWPTPATGYVSSHFGYRLHPIRGTWRLHEGVDIETAAGTPAFGTATGTVLKAWYDKACGNTLRIQHPSLAIRTVYCHGEKLLVKDNQAVKAGSQVMITGNTGSSSASNHLHFGVWKDGAFTDPMDWL